MKHLFVPYKQALELKNLGFDDSCLAFYDIIYNPISQKYYGNLLLGRSPEYLKSEKQMLYIFGQQKLLAPTYSQAFRWFIDNHNLLYYWEKPKLKEDYYWNFLIYNEITGEKIFVVRAKHNKEAELACLIKLIQIVKEKL